MMADRIDLPINNADLLLLMARRLISENLVPLPYLRARIYQNDSS
jgi:hypothetical protein